MKRNYKIKVTSELMAEFNQDAMILIDNQNHVISHY